ncbi:hypothetical protein BD413DRAFT_612771 [Trametes elegans]|nr:hypothetical protein BD413DRAFT_612771 [Trametes elegans]
MQADVVCSIADIVQEGAMEIGAFGEDAYLVTPEVVADPMDVPDLHFSFDLPPSSPPPSSSPPHIFSSPPRELCESTPSSSPPATVTDELATASGGHDDKAVVDIPSDTMSEEEAVQFMIPFTVKCCTPAPTEEERPAKRMRTEPSPHPELPLPKRLTQASVAKQRKKLAAPFRSPVIKGPLIQGGLHAVYATGRAFTPPPPRKVPTDEAAANPSSAIDIKPDPTVANKDRTANVAKQFKSPLVSGTAASASTSNTPSSALFSTVKATPTIQALQGRLQALKQAVRIKKDGGDNDDELERLVAKWTTAGREVAWAVWDYAKDLGPGTSSVGEQSTGGWFADSDERWSGKAGQKRGFDPNWGYDDNHPAKKAKMEEGGGEEAGMDDDDTQPVVQHTLGTMLRHLSIDPATLGWDEEEGDFVDT